ncbi:YhgE/Pip domain-containing protein [Microbacterium fluvii]|uniref:YhgE/Pip domain-containing protein n=1 Tax=Microbacterium fluvii TaxID=415215 RepID=A0ABW2HCJ8_9MICO|nr:SNG1 family protein [Microbacterium fluvii]MCU4671810.1 SNG1 family protein [Microbacterium fluvii]
MSTEDTQVPDMTARHGRSRPRWLMWLAPVLVVTAFCAALSATYFGGTINSAENISEFPVAIVNADAGTSLPSGEELTIGDDIQSALLENVDEDKFDISVLSLDEATARMDNGSLYGVILLPETLSEDFVGLGRAAFTTEGAQPYVQVQTNPRVGAFAASIVTQLGREALSEVSAALGTQLQSLAASTATTVGVTEPLTAAASQALADPLDVQIVAHNPLPDGTGGGLSAFFYALVLVLAGFSGTIIANSIIDARLGVMPLEAGPRYSVAPWRGFSRTRTFALKLVLMGIVALLVAGVYILIASATGMPIDEGWPLFGFSALAIFGIASIAQTVVAVVGNAGMMINLFIMVVFAIPSSGGTIPLEATPGFFRWLATFEPMHQIYIGVRSILYFGAAPDAGLTTAITASVIGIAISLVLGFGITARYDALKMKRGPLALAA